MDGWGLGKVASSDAIKACSHCHLQIVFICNILILPLVTREAVGLPNGQMGNSEVGHLNLGAGRIVYQELQRINVAVRDGSFASNPVLLESIAYAA